MEGQQKVHHLRGAQGAHGWSGRPFGARFLPTHVCPARAERRGAWTWHTSEMLDLWIKFGEYNQLAFFDPAHFDLTWRVPTCTPANHSRAPPTFGALTRFYRRCGYIRQDGAGCSPRAHRGPWAAASPPALLPMAIRSSRRRATPQALHRHPLLRHPLRQTPWPQRLPCGAQIACIPVIAATRPGSQHPAPRRLA